MPRFVRPVSLTFGFLAAVAFAQPPAGQLPVPRIATVFPGGAKAGSSVEVTVNGTDLAEVTGLLFSHPGLSAELVREPEPKPDPKAKAPPAKKAPNAAAVKFRVAVARDVPEGLYDLRATGPLSVSNPRFFAVGFFPEVNEAEPNNDVPEAQLIPVGTTVNGVIGAPTDVDYIRFTAVAGQRVFVHCATGSLESRARPLLELYASDGRRIAQNRNGRGTDALLDATCPTEGTYYVRLCEFAYQTGGPEHFYRLTIFEGPWVDAVFPPVVPPDRQTVVSIVGRGRSKDLSSLGVLAHNSPVTLLVRMKYEPVLGLMDGFGVQTLGSPVSVPLFFAREPVALETSQPNDMPATAQVITVPCELCGRIDVKNDLDWFRFAAKKGEALTIDLAVERVGTAMDCYLIVTDAKTGREIAGENQLDDDPDILHPIGYFSRTADPPPYRFVPPADGEYLVRVASREANVTFGPRAIYRLRIAPPRPDFRAIVMPRSRELPSSVTCRPGTDTAVDVYVQRLDGYAGPVTVTATHLPDGVTAVPTVVGTNQKWGTLVLKTKPGVRTLAGFAGFIPRTKTETADATGTFEVVATAEIEGKTLTRLARPATITWGIAPGANVPTATRIDQTLPIAVRGAFAVPAFSLAPDFDKATTRRDGKDVPVKPPFALRPGERVVVPFTVSYAAKDRPAVALAVEPTHNDTQRSPLSGNVANVTGSIPKDKPSASLTFEMRPNAAPGKYRFVVRGDVTGNVTRPTDKRVVPNVVQSAFAAIDVRVVPTSLAKLSVASPTVKAGGTTTLTVKLERLLDYAGTFAVEVTLPEGRGLSVSPSKVITSKDEATFTITAAKDAKPGRVENMVVNAVAIDEGVRVSQEAKVGVSVVK